MCRIYFVSLSWAGLENQKKIVRGQGYSKFEGIFYFRSYVFVYIIIGI